MKISLPDRGGDGAVGCVAKLIPGLVAFAFVAMGSWLTFVMGRSLIAAFAVHGWERAECEVVTSAVEERSRSPEADASGEEFVFTVTYRYHAGGEEWVDNRLRPRYEGSDDPRPAQLLLDRYPAGARVPCWVDPDDPAAAYLERARLVTGLWILFPLLFVGVGLAVLAGLWWPARWRRREARPDEARREEAGGAPLSKKPVAAGWGAGCLVAFFAVFFFTGLGIVGFLSLRPAARAWAAREWRETPCVVLRSDVGIQSDSDGTTYSVDVLYAYTVAGREYTSRRYDFLSGTSSGGYEGKAAIVERLPPGTRTVCWVDPEDPTRAVLERGIHRGYLIGLVGLPFLLAGAGGIGFTLWGWRRLERRRAARAPDWLPSAASPEALAAGLGPAVVAGPTTLRPRSTPLGKFVGITFAALFWNGITGVFVWQMVQGWRAGAGDGCLTLFLVPFVLVGLLLLVSVPYQLLALFNPRPVLTLERGVVAPGQALQLTWRFRGLAGRVRRLRIVVAGREEATYRRGTTTSTDRETFATIAVVDTSNATEIPAGAATLALPADAMHTFVAPHNKVLWTLAVAGEIARWPDVAEEFELLVLPREVAG